MLNIFANETIYGSWTVTQCVNLEDATDKSIYNAMDEVATVTESDRGYGKSVCFTLSGGKNKVYKALSSTSDLKVGDTIKKSKCFVLVLSKTGEDDIYRISDVEVKVK